MPVARTVDESRARHDQLDLSVRAVLAGVPLPLPLGLLVDVGGADRPILRDGLATGHAVDPRRGDLHEALQLEPRALLEDVLRRLVVHLPVVLVGQPGDAKLPRHVDGRVRLETGAPEVHGVRQVAAVVLHGRAFGDRGLRPVDHQVDLMTPIQQRLQQAAPDEPCPARQQDPHISITRRITSSGRGTQPRTFGTPYSEAKRSVQSPTRSSFPCP